ncbi:uncharacterized protein FOMMEDRAFT_166075 [Fomitiporia mediterranea MF3/22]|uniref:uncharacterized protein n=1 Tax=Fomitiporia mediterranea (strain MF3/22) TaxID=694068 RepID=UPI0004409A0B|nr:uncharacterized protein FOMMEDRAFT_166075 [Fomitiporia mediterranea MF3/22]EJD05725.1 hypothetical protein FOMMEDRAFT_166075 [Fomitiporia mediterranea MF3/22]
MIDAGDACRRMQILILQENKAHHIPGSPTSVHPICCLWVSPFSSAAHPTIVFLQPANSFISSALVVLCVLSQLRITHDTRWLGRRPTGRNKSTVRSSRDACPAETDQAERWKVEPYILPVHMQLISGRPPQGRKQRK